jgi:hypothetical protein
MDSTSDEKLVSASELLQVLWNEESRPSLRWLRYQTKARSIPFIKIGGKVFFAPRAVLASIKQKNTVQGRCSHKQRGAMTPETEAP